MITQVSSNKIIQCLTISIVISISCTFSLNEFVIAQAENQDHGKVFVMYAGSLLKIFEDKLGPSFQNQTGFTFQGESKGSVQSANMILEGFRKPDVFVSAGTIPILKLANNNPPFVHWWIKFSSAELVIMYSPNSRFHTELDLAKSGNIPWYKVLSEKGFKLGRTDPELDPKGYNTIIAAKLSNIHYNDSGLKQRILGEDRNLKQIFPEEILNSVLESGQVDAIFAYKHEAISRSLPYITLPPQINLGNQDFATFYKNASYTFSSNNRTAYGQPIYFSISIPDTNKNMDAATSFTNFVL
jgi:molybdate/tungstate transport system substrate-binding protein